jgi:hypothetical protein
MAQRRRSGGKSGSSSSEKAEAQQPSDVDAMGQDKRRQVVGHSYGPSKRSQVPEPSPTRSPPRGPCGEPGNAYPPPRQPLRGSDERKDH